MPNGANYIHKQLRLELENYIKSQYFGKSPLLLSALSDHIDDEGLLYQKPFIESSPAYLTKPDGFKTALIPTWMKDYFLELVQKNLGVFSSPFAHQIEALEAAVRGENIFVSTGTGSGKTECFTWPLMAKLASEGRNSKRSWSHRGVRAIVMYPMNALVSDQISRLRKMLGDPQQNFAHIFRNVCGPNVRRPQFGMYTGRTPYPGEPSVDEDQKLEKTLRNVVLPKQDSDRNFYERLLKDGKIPAKVEIEGFLQGLKQGLHIPNPEDAELITRFEMQQFCPDILITNYSMLEYMLLRPREAKIWNETREWLRQDPENKLLFIIDEAHMYRGSAGGEVSLLIRRLFHKLGITRDRVQFILTSASMPDKIEADREAVKKFANELTASDTLTSFRYLTGHRETMDGQIQYDIPSHRLLNFDPSPFEDRDEVKLPALLSFWKNIPGFDPSIRSLDAIYSWMYSNLPAYRPFNELIQKCRGNAVSLNELALEIFPSLSREDGLKAVSILLAIAALARNEKGVVLFPARMHMLFRGISGVYACTNPECSHSHSGEGITLGEIYLSNGNLVCPHCGSVIYELYNDRRCGALFYKGYILEDNVDLKGKVYLWQSSGQLIDQRMKEIHLYIPPENYKGDPAKKAAQNPVRLCYLDTRSGFINFKDDEWEDRLGVRKLYYCNYSTKGRPDVITFSTCPHCKQQLSKAQLTSFGMRGNQSFFNLIKSQFQLQPAVPGKDQDPERYPNEGRKVLLFSDSRQRAAKLARDMSDASEIAATAQLFVLAINQMENEPDQPSLDVLYDYFCVAAVDRHVQLFHGEQKNRFDESCGKVKKREQRKSRRRNERRSISRLSMDDCPPLMQEFFLRLFSGVYNTFYDWAACWIEPTDDALDEIHDTLEDSQIEVSDEEIIEFFNAWILTVNDSSMALGDHIPDEIRQKVRPGRGYGLDSTWDFPQSLLKSMNWEKKDSESSAWKSAFDSAFLTASSSGNGRRYINLKSVRPRLDLKHRWYKCEKCSKLTPYLLKGKCPNCRSEHVHEMIDDDYEALSFWRKPLEEALSGAPIRVIDTEEHTAQLSHKDQRDDLWSKTEKYELRFQDLIQADETPVDILSSTTTMEVGIDIGSLVAIGLRNIPPTRENYQQRAGRAGRRGSSLSTIVTFCEDGPHNTLYFNNPVPMFRGDPRGPWIDVNSEKLLQRHMTMVLLQEYLKKIGQSLDQMPAANFIQDHLESFKCFVVSNPLKQDHILLPVHSSFDYHQYIQELSKSLKALKDKLKHHPEQFGTELTWGKTKQKPLLDVVYEEGIVPTYSFPKNVVSTYISDSATNQEKILYEVSRGLDVAIGEYAPGRSIVVDKTTYQIGGLYYPVGEWMRNRGKPARSYSEDPNYVKHVLSCPNCGWFGLMEEKTKACPFCGNTNLEQELDMTRPWGFAPMNGVATTESQLNESYSAVQTPVYSTLPEADEMVPVGDCKYLRKASRTNQRIIMLNKGPQDQGFVICKDCGAAAPGTDGNALKKVKKPYHGNKTCRHIDWMHVNLGYDFITDMLVLEFTLDDHKMDTSQKENPWLNRAAQSLAEAFRLVASKKLDIEFSELVAGYRLRKGPKGSFVDIYLYDSLSSGAGYAVSISDYVPELLQGMKKLLTFCHCASACSNCLKHYQNQFVHGMLDRFAALQLLEWGMTGTIAKPIDARQQTRMITPLMNILHESGCNIVVEGETIFATQLNKRKKIVAYPSMWSKPKEANTVFVPDIYFKYAKPYAVQAILDGMK